jgi:hypothetical protein
MRRGTSSLNSGDAMRIYRVENDEHLGPYIVTSFIRAWASSLHNDSKHPPPWEDFGGSAFETDWKVGMKDARFGFATLGQFKCWFTVIERRKLRKLGFKLAIYEVEKSFAKRSACQALFDITKARLMSKRALR